MWKYISGVSKVVEEKKKEKATKATCDQSKEYYEKSESWTRKFSTKWQVGRRWLKNDKEKDMICKWRVANKQTLIVQNINKTRPDLLMAALAIERSRYRITRKVQHIFSQSSVIELTYAQKKTQQT